MLSGGLDSRLAMKMIKFGRPFRLNDDVKIIVGRDEEENKFIGCLARRKDYILQLADRLDTPHSVPDNIHRAGQEGGCYVCIPKMSVCDPGHL